MKTTWKCLLALCAAFGASAGAQQLAVYPSEVTLNNAHDVERLVAVVTRPDGVTVDVTPEVTVQLSAENVAAWGDDLKLYAAGDGEATLTVTHGDLSVQLPVKVENSGLTPPRPFPTTCCPPSCAHLTPAAATAARRGKRLPPEPLRVRPAVRLHQSDPRPAEPPDQRRAARRGLMLLKPLGKVDHEGGTALEEGGGVHETLLQWIRKGRSPTRKICRDCRASRILSARSRARRPGANQRFVVMANYDNGTTRDVTDVAVLVPAMSSP